MLSQTPEMEVFIIMRLTVSSFQPNSTSVSGIPEKIHVAHVMNCIKKLQQLRPVQGIPFSIWWRSCKSTKERQILSTRGRRRQRIRSTGMSPLRLSSLIFKRISMPQTRRMTYIANANYTLFH